MLPGLESLIGSLGLVVGVTYLVGGLIVNLNLSQSKEHRVAVKMWEQES